jgi:F-type H+-transporting ATPase subunit a
MNKIKPFNKIALLIATCIALVLPVSFAFAQHNETITQDSSIQSAEAPKHDGPHGESHEEKFNAGELIMGHIADAHDWHLWGHTASPTPCIY